MWTNYLRIIYSRKFRRLFLILLALILSSILLPLFIILDITCIPQTYEPKITLRQLNGNKAQVDVPVLTHPKWTPITDNILSIYSAFHYRNQVLVIGIIDKNYKNVDFFCQYSPINQRSITKSSIITLPESWENYYSFISIKIICANIEFSDNLKVKISFVSNGHSLETSSIPINSIAEDNTRHKDNNPLEKSIVVCVRPLFGPFSSSAELLEFLAYYRVNGIKEFIFYDLSITKEIKDLLKNMPFVQLLSFHLPIESNDIHADGQIAAINDCLLRSADKVIINVDIDELIVTSKRFANIKEFVSNRIGNQEIGGLVVPNVMVCDEFNAKIHFPRILSATMRQTFKWEPRDRSKAIILKPLSVHRLGIHTVWTFTDKSVNENVDQNDAMLFHYRSCCRVWQPFYHSSYTGITLYFHAYEDNIVSDLGVTRFEPQIIQFLKKYIIF